MSYSFDGAGRIIQIGGGQVLVEAADLYSRWKDWVAAGNAQFPPAFRSIGGDPLGGGASAGAYYFLNNIDGWRIRPQAFDHELVIEGNLFGEDAASAVFLPAVGDFQVLIRQVTSSLTQQVDSGGAGGGLTGAQATQLIELWRRMGLDPAAPLVATPAGINAGPDIEIELTGDGVNSSTATRIP